MAQGNVKTFYSAVPAVSVDGNINPSIRPYLVDLNVEDVRCILPCYYVDSLGIKRTGIEISYWHSKLLRLVTVVFDVVDFATIDDVLTYFETTLNDGSQILQKYVNWTKWNLFKTIVTPNMYPSSSILLNNKQLKMREYVPLDNTTNLHMNMGPGLDLEIFTVSGAQNISKDYYYTGSLV